MQIIKANTKINVGEPVFYFDGDVSLQKHGKVLQVIDNGNKYKVLWDSGVTSPSVPSYNVITERDGLDFIEDASSYQDIDEIEDYPVFASTQPITSAVKPSTANQYANTFSNYLYKHIDTAYNYDKSVGNIFDIYMITESEPQLDIKINVTTYADKVRINVFYTGTKDLIVSIILQPKKFTPKDSESSMKYLLDRIYSRLRKLGEIE